VLSAAVVAVMAATPGGSVSLSIARAIIFLAFAINLCVAVWGIWSRHRYIWIAYLIISLAGIAAFGPVPPAVGLYILWASHLCGWC